MINYNYVPVIRRAGGGQLFSLGRGGIPPTPPFRRALASGGKNFCGLYPFSLVSSKLNRKIISAIITIVPPLAQPK
jgi:hypothetical protein